MAYRMHKQKKRSVFPPFCLCRFSTLRLTQRAILHTLKSAIVVHGTLYAEARRLGARGAQYSICPATWAFQFKIESLALGEQAVTVSASDFFVMCSRHFLMVLGLRPDIRPDMRLRARHEHNRRRILRMICPYHVGPWSGVSSPGRWGSSHLPRLCLKFVFSCPSSRRNLRKAPARRLRPGGAGQTACAGKR